MTYYYSADNNKLFPWDLNYLKKLQFTKNVNDI